LTAILRRARSLLRLRLLLQQLGLAAVVSILFVLWLHVPDSSVIEEALSLLMALVIAFVALGGESFLLLQTCPLSYTDGRKRIQIGALALLAAALLWFAWSALLEHWSASDSLLAGYLNSRVAAHYRNFFSYNHLYNWLEDAWLVLRWLATGLLLAATLALLLALRRGRAALRLMLSFTYWIVFALAAVVGSYLTHALLQWTPGHGLPVESISLVLRLGTVILVDLILICLPFTTAIAVIERYEARTA
jgi:hypothetical protein